MTSDKAGGLRPQTTGNNCPICGKNQGLPGHIHTCSPPDGVMAWMHSGPHTPSLSFTRSDYYNVPLYAAQPSREGGQDAKDAARYRWLRDCAPFGDLAPDDGPVVAWCATESASGLNIMDGADLDEAVDAALAAAAPKPKG